MNCPVCNSELTDIDDPFQVYSCINGCYTKNIYKVLHIDSYYYENFSIVTDYKNTYCLDLQRKRYHMFPNNIDLKDKYKRDFAVKEAAKYLSLRLFQ